jgi:uncharacterized protein YdiU (UPF0061 family)
MVTKARLGTRMISSLTADPSAINLPRQVEASHFSFVKPRHFPNAKILIWNEDLASQLGMTNDTKKEWQGLLSLQREFDNDSSSFALCYGGHQFGVWAGQLGDGRAINLGEVSSHDFTSIELQLKGAGPTPYSRSADGYAVLRSSIREFLCSEAMYYLGVPTTRALSLSLTGELVWRDMMYNGNLQQEPGAVVCRSSKSFIRFGNFEILAARKEWDLLRALVDFCIHNYFSHIQNDDNKIIQFFKEVTNLSCHMVVEWMRVGFVHGVMNTDNMSIIGETIDYGPYGWIDNYDEDWTPNTTDLPAKRYAFGKQPFVVQWNLLKLANALAPLVEDKIDSLKEIIENFAPLYSSLYHEMMVSKLGIISLEYDEQRKVIAPLLDLLSKDNIDMTIFFRNLANLQDTKSIEDFVIQASYNDYVSDDMKVWCTNYIQKISEIDPPYRKSMMDKVNPKYVLRNYIAQMVIDQTHHDEYKLLKEVFEMIKYPYTDNKRYDKWFKKRPEWAMQKIGCSMLSCSS